MFFILVRIRDFSFVASAENTVNKGSPTDLHIWWVKERQKEFLSPFRSKNVRAL